ncbi:phage tail protein [Streptomyces sp. NPDC050264]|uniref:phage tail protein n=1 Tax=Streptomyces sp. NPDC050264 TaxID=3155038 RepID=UPI003446C159
MPVITAPKVVDPGDPGDGGTPPVEVPEVGYATITYIDPAGTRWPMTNLAGDWFVLAEGVSGLGAAPYTLTSDPHPRGGARLRHVQPQPRSIVWPLLVKGADHNVFTANWRALARAFTRTLREGPGLLEVARPTGSIRRIPVYYQDGWDGRGQRATGITWDSATVTLWCEDPYWIDAVPVGIHRESGVLVDFLAPYPSVSSGQVLGATTVTNVGDVEVWPTWTITGPATRITFTREDTDETFIVDPATIGKPGLGSGEQVIVSTDPPQVRGPGGNWIGALNWPEAVLWPLPPGDTAVTFQLTGAGPGSAVDLTYFPRYETA